LGGLGDNGLYLASGSDTIFIRRVEGSSVSHITYHLKAAHNIKKGGHKLDVTFLYAGREETQTIYLNSGGDNDQSSNLLIENIVEPKSAVKANENFTIKFDLRNNGGVTAKNILVKVESNDPAIIPKTTNIKRIN